MTDLSTYEGRRAEWAQAVLSGEFEPYLGGGLGAVIRSEDGKLRRCCLGVGCDVIIQLTGESVIEIDPNPYGGKMRYRKTGYTGLETEDSSTGFLPTSAARWFGTNSVRPEAELDQEFIDGFAAHCAELRERNEEVPVIVGLLADDEIQVGDQVALHSMNDAGVPWSLIGGLIARERIYGAKHGPVED